MSRPIPADLQGPFAEVLSQLRDNFGEDLLGVYALVQDEPHVIAVTEVPLTQEQRASLSLAYRSTLNRDIGLTLFTTGQLQQGHPYEADLSYDPAAKREFSEDDFTLGSETNQPLTNTARLRALRHRGHVLAGPPIALRVPTVSDDEYRVALSHDAEWRLKRLASAPTVMILHLCRILAFWRLKLVLPTDEAGAWAIKTLDPRFQTLIERANIEHQSGAEPGAYNTYQLQQFADYVRDMLRR